jgi:hypothetical protein
MKDWSCTSKRKPRVILAYGASLLLLPVTGSLNKSYCTFVGIGLCRLRLKCDGTRAETGFRVSAKRTNSFKSAGWGDVSSVDSLAAEVCASAVVMLDTPCSEVVWRVLATHSIRQFPLHFPSRASPCAITFELDTTSLCIIKELYILPTQWICVFRVILSFKMLLSYTV